MSIFIGSHSDVSRSTLMGFVCNETRDSYKKYVSLYCPKKKILWDFRLREIFIIHVGATLSSLSFVYNKHMVFSNSITMKYPCLLTPPLNCILWFTFFQAKDTNPLGNNFCVWCGCGDPNGVLRSASRPMSLEKCSSGRLFYQCICSIYEQLERRGNLISQHPTPRRFWLRK